MLKPFSRNFTRSRWRRYFRQFLRTVGRSETDNNIASGAAVDYVGVDVRVKFGDFRSNGSRDIQWADFVLNERTCRRLSHRAETPYMPFAKTTIMAVKTNSDWLKMSSRIINQEKA